MRFRIRGKIFIPMALALVALIVVVFVILNSQLNRVSSEFIREIGLSKMEEIDSSMALSFREAESVSALFVRMAEVEQAYRVALSGNIDDETSPQSMEARGMLRSELAGLLDSFESVRGEPLMLHFHLPNGRSLVRLWREKNFIRDGEWIDISDDISGFRETVMHVNRTGRPAQGLEVGRGGFTVRSVLPVSSARGEHLGSVEMLIEFEPIVEAAAAGDGQELLLYMNHDLLQIAQRLQDPSRHPVLDNRFVKVSGTDDPRINSLVTSQLLDQGRQGLTVETAGNYSLAVFPVVDFTGEQVGVMAYVLDTSDIQGLIRNLSLTLLLIMAGLLILLMVVGQISTNYAVIKPLRRIMGFARQVAQGDLEQQLEIASKDEMENLAGSLQSMVDNLKEKIAEAEEKTNHAREEAERAEGFRLKAEEAMKKAGQAQKEGMLSAASRIEDITESLSSASEELSAQVEQASRGSEEQQQRTQETATAMEEMNATVLEVAKNASKAADFSEEAQNTALRGSQTVQEAIKAIMNVQKSAEELKSKIAGLGERAEGIGKIMTVIEDIADQTNLLALNAAIEAARAGDAGRGFAVVADEVRKLAEKTMSATKEVGDSIHAIQEDVKNNARSVDTTVDSVKAATELSGRSGKELDEIVTLAEKASDQVRAIATASEEQSSASEEINRSIDDINRVAGETADVMAQSAQAISDLARRATELQSLVQEMKDQA
ncbi:methyl-accepting chemotaxis protein [Desulfonatronovibrio hydrogenovorans]|uniref:methyl-accepting chemotaxis protein n=1 Tax=Desulfonatronovibrio hydrogenovorans TaxID=53245 RepID=UPI0006917BC1|nr:methyl-accepting chemotaxis protein [Desulfonatronovibrio hydrogenovorans]